MVHLKYNNLTEAWENINEMFLRHDPVLMEQGASLTNASFAYDLKIDVDNPVLDPEFKFGEYFHYTIGKWSKLISNYLDLDVMDQVKEQIRQMEANKAVQRYYNVGFQFVDSHDNGKGCLLSGVFSRELNNENPIITIYTRAAEVTSRMAFDFLFFQRMGEYVYGKIPFRLCIYIKQAWSDDNISLMYHNHRPLKRVLKKCESEKRKETIMKALDKMLNGKDEDFVKYQAHHRVFKTLRPDLHPKAAKTKQLTAKDCEIGNWDGIPLPPNCPSIAVRNIIKKKMLQLQDKYGIDLSKGTQDEAKAKNRKVISMKGSSEMFNEPDFLDEDDD